jgi:predicted phosphodiesterase
MKIQIFSDLHQEIIRNAGPDVPHCWDGVIPHSDADVIVLAGDIDNGAQGVEWAVKESQRLQKPIVYVPGNHEYYYEEYFNAKKQMAAMGAGTEVHLLDRSVWVQADVRFIGATLWTDYEVNTTVHRDMAMQFVERGLPDHMVIRFRHANHIRNFLPGDALCIHEQELAWLQQQLEIPFDGKTIVVTHHGPHPCCQHPGFLESKITGAFFSDLTQLLESNDIDAWVYGHTHSNLDVVVSGTRIISNQAGYPEEGVQDFNNNLVVEI